MIPAPLPVLEPCTVGIYEELRLDEERCRRDTAGYAEEDR
jgi:hypothetical protein